MTLFGFLQRRTPAPEPSLVRVFAPGLAGVMYVPVPAAEKEAQS